MTLPDPLTAERTQALLPDVPEAAHGDGPQPAGPPPQGEPGDAPVRAAPVRAAAVRAAARRAAVRLARRALRTPAGRAALEAARHGARVLVPPDDERHAEVDARLAGLSDRVDDLAARRVDETALLGRIEANRVNAQLMKAEVRALERTLVELGMALAPATGLAGVATRFGELREQVNAVSRRLRQIDPLTGGGATPARPPQGGDLADPAAGAARTLSAMDEHFDYVAFERRFRGAPRDVLAVQEERYADLLAAHGPVVDLGCGRGELAEALMARGTDVIGVEPDAGMVAQARDRGVSVHQSDAASFLRSAAPGSLGAVFSAHVAEHIPFDDLLELVHLSLDRLAPGGVFVAETPNPAALIVPSNSFILDPTHLRPVHPSLFAFVCETAGFRDVRLTFYAPATGYFLDVPPDDGTPTTRAVAQHATKLNEVLFGPQEYAVVATKAR